MSRLKEKHAEKGTMHVKIKNGTRPDVDLCRTCTSATIAEGAGAMHLLKRCNLLESLVPFPVTACNDWRDRSEPYLSEMKEIAWVLEIKGTRPVGFLSPAERRKNGERI